MEDIDNKLYIIIVKDNEMDSILLETKLKEKPEYKTQLFTKAEKLLTYLEAANNKADVIILDSNLSTDRVLAAISKKNPLAEVVLLCDAATMGKAKKGVYAEVVKDRNAIEKLFIIIENIKSNRKLKWEKVDFEQKAKRRQTLVVTLVFILLLIFVLAVYFIFFR